MTAAANTAASVAVATAKPLEVTRIERQASVSVQSPFGNKTTQLRAPQTHHVHLAKKPIAFGTKDSAAASVPRLAEKVAKAVAKVDSKFFGFVFCFLLLLLLGVRENMVFNSPVADI